MVFGEIIEPSTRALCNDEYDDGEICDLSWKVTPCTPTTVKKLFITDTTPLLSVFKVCILSDVKPKYELNETNLKIYEICDNNYVIASDDPKTISGNITEIIAPWIKCAAEVIILTTASDLPSGIKQLSYKMRSIHPKLDVPNLVTGISASVFSYCVHINKNCSLFKVFLDEAPLDSINTVPLLNLIKTLGLNVLKMYKFQETSCYSNLYI
ncbi:hypothetical protein RI129_012303 [Pyrocoelia pectoralis]|uniref:Proteasome assembly chaperone 1 n=1 Tax=Pyrocoelia pectoralis TaxID=417401 RepID=A0AAN7UYY3_9COLE